MEKSLFLLLLVYTGISFLANTLLVILYFRIYPDKMALLFPVSVIAGCIVGILSYLPIKSILGKRKE